MKNHQISATLHWTVAYHFSLGTQPGSMVHVEPRKKSYFNVYIVVKVFKDSLDQYAGKKERGQLSYWREGWQLSESRTYCLEEACCLADG